jgi:hypothetical protein
MKRTLASLAALAALAAGPLSPARPLPVAAAGPAVSVQGLHVVGSQIVNGDGAVLLLAPDGTTHSAAGDTFTLTATTPDGLAVLVRGNVAA